MGTHGRLGSGVGWGGGGQGQGVPVHEDAGGAGEEGGGSLWMEGGRVRGGRVRLMGGRRTRGVA
jgi:hypothetical protein